MTDAAYRSGKKGFNDWHGQNVFNCSNTDKPAGEVTYYCCQYEYEFFAAVHNVNVNIRIILKVHYRAVRIEKVATGFIMESFPTAQQVMHKALNGMAAKSNSPHPQMELCVIFACFVYLFLQLICYW